MRIKPIKKPTLLDALSIFEIIFVMSAFGTGLLLQP
jgi:hypothetical protein